MNTGITDKEAVMNDELGSVILSVVLTLLVVFILWTQTTVVGETDNGIYYITTHWNTYQLASPEPIEIKQIIVKDKVKKEVIDDDNIKCQCCGEDVASQPDTEDQGTD